jgi:hypothetical protein
VIKERSLEITAREVSLEVTAGELSQPCIKLKKEVLAWSPLKKVVIKPL